MAKSFNDSYQDERIPDNRKYQLQRLIRTMPQRRKKSTKTFKVEEKGTWKHFRCYRVTHNKSGIVYLVRYRPPNQEHFKNATYRIGIIEKDEQKMKKKIQKRRRKYGRKVYGR